MNQKRLMEIEKSREEFAFRLLIAEAAKDAKQAAILRLEILVQFVPEKTNRQIFNRAKINCKGR